MLDAAASDLESQRSTMGWHVGFGFLAGALTVVAGSINDTDPPQAKVAAAA